MFLEVRGQVDGAPRSSSRLTYQSGAADGARGVLGLVNGGEAGGMTERSEKVPQVLNSAIYRL